jgi:hypothetical protein
MYSKGLEDAAVSIDTLLALMFDKKVIAMKIEFLQIYELN